MSYPTNKEVIVGAGILAGLEVYSIFKKNEHNPEEMPRLTMYRKDDISTAEEIAPSLTPDEIVSVIPPLAQLLEKLKKLFVEDPTGIGVDDIPGINETKPVKRFIEEVSAYKEGEKAKEVLLALGKLSMELWQKLYDEGDLEFKKILEDSNFHPCREPKSEALTLGDGYRVDLIYGVEAPQEKAKGMINDYEKLGYHQCKILSPAEVENLDPSLAAFCEKHTESGSNGELKWKEDVTALYRPGGCINAGIFLPKLYAYLERKMGTYENEKGETKNRFRLKMGREINGIIYSDKEENHIQGLTFSSDREKTNKRYKVCEYVFSPGESVGTLEKLGFNEPASVGFAGTSLKLKLPLDKMPQELREKYARFNQWMEVHTNGIVLAWQGKIIDDVLCISVGGTKTCYGHEKPTIEQNFARVSNVRQLEVIRQVVPDLIDFAMKGCDVAGETLTEEHLNFLKREKIAECWVGRRAAAYNGVPTMGPLYKNDKEVENASCNTHAGSGGVSFAPILVAFNQLLRGKPSPIADADENLLTAVKKMSNSRRTALGG